MHRKQQPIISLETWLASPMGEYVRAWEQQHLDRITADIFGFHALQIGLPQVNTLNANRMPYHWGCVTALPASEDRQKGLSLVVTEDFTNLPFASQSVDLVVLPHVLEFAAEPHQVLREVERILMPEGQVIICGFNPASLWGARQACSRLFASDFLPPSSGFISMLRMRDWLKLLNMEVDKGHFGCYAPALRTQKWLQHFDFMEKAGEQWWPYFGAVYMVRAVKRVVGMRLVGPALNKKAARVTEGVPVTNKVHQRNQ